MNRNENNKTPSSTRNNKALTQKTKKDEKNSKLPLYKIFMDEFSGNTTRKFHLIKNQKSYPNKVSNKNYFFANDCNNRYCLKIKLYVYQILKSKYNCTPDLYEKNNLDILVTKKKCHYLANFNEMGYCTPILTEYLKREYSLKEVNTRIPQYASYYKNYLQFFCKPFFINYQINKRMVKHMEKVAQIFYNENYADEDENKEKSKSIKKMPKIFSKDVLTDIENGESFTYVNSEDATEQLNLINKKLKKNELLNKNEKKNVKKEKKENNARPIVIEESTIIESNYIITPIYEKEEFQQKLKNNKQILYDIDKDKSNKKNSKMKISQSTSSIKLLLKEMTQDKKENLFLRNVKEINDNPYNPFTFRNINGFISPSTKVNTNIINTNTDKTKTLKNINNNCILIENGKTTNNINININNLTIEKKIISKKGSFNKIITNLRELNNMNNDNILKKTITKFKYKNSTNNSLLKLKERNSKKLINIKSNTESAPNNTKNQNTKPKKSLKKNGLLTLPPHAINVLPNFQTNHTQKYSKIIPSTLAYQVKKTRNQSIFKLGFNSGSTSNIYKHRKLNYFSNDSNKYGRLTLHGNEKINLKNILNNNNNLLSGQRTKNKNENNDIQRPKKIFTSILHLNKAGSEPFFNLKNKLDTYKNSENGIISPINKKKKDILISKMKIKELKLKEKQLNFHKIMNLMPNKKRSKSNN